MRIFNESKTQELINPDLSLGYLKPEELFIRHVPYQPPVKEEGHYETVSVYSNGGKDVRWVVDVEGMAEKEAYDEIENIQVYIPYNQKELSEMKIKELKRNLADTDYQAIKYAEGVLTESEYAPMKAQREKWRAEINALEASQI